MKSGKASEKASRVFYPHVHAQIPSQAENTEMRLLSFFFLGGGGSITLTYLFYLSNLTDGRQ